MGAMTKVQQAALLFGITSLLFGALSFVPALAPGGTLWGTFMVGGMHALLHITTGISGMIVGVRSASARLYFKFIGGFYALLAVAGIFTGAVVLGMMMNTADNLLHVAIAVFALYVGFAMKESAMRLGISNVPSSSAV
jgi:hypothetical protein